MGNEPYLSESWRKSLTLSAGLLILMLAYRFFYDGELSIEGVAGSIASTAGFLFGISFGLSSAAHYLEWPRSFLGLRKQIGINGYLHAVAYTALLVAIDPGAYFADFPWRLLSLPSILGIVAMLMLTAMFLASNDKAFSTLGASRWQAIMNGGYIAYAMLVIRAAILEWNLWIAWLAHPQGLPPPRLVLSIFACGVILARLSIIGRKN